jgi:inhibitor of KinA sporulation pathway (predicted exonuclease)
MNIMALDCEFAQPSGKCIQIGAAIYSANKGELQGTFESYVNPGEPITQYITDLTGIKDSDVSSAPSILEAFLDLQLFAKKHKAWRNPLVWGSGVRNDSHAIYSEAYPTEELRKENPNFMGFRVLDAKTLFQSIQVFNNDKIAGGLKASCEKLGIGFEGDAHRALTDAINTFRVWHFLLKKFPERYK